MSDDYSFLQEKIKDKAGSPKTMKKKVVRMVICGFIFGIVACFTFVALNPVISGLLGRDKEEISIPEDAVVSENETKYTPSAQERAEEQQQMSKIMLFGFCFL